jgi:methylthioribose-1-phosphate isomerase
MLYFRPGKPGVGSMKIGGKHYRSVWLEPDGRTVSYIDQTRLPFEFKVCQLASVPAAAHAIRTMQVRGAPLIGAVAAFGVALAMAEDASDAALDEAYQLLLATRPTAINLAWALDRMRYALRNQPILNQPGAQRVAAAFREAQAICNEDVAACEAIGRHGLELIRAAYKSGPVNILTHCNAGWIACVDWGTALAPIYMAHDAGIPVHVWVDETRPRNQGAQLTAWELGAHGVPHTVIVDNAGGHLMQRGLVDLCIVGTDRTTAGGDVCNKIGTYLKALAAHDNKVPFYVALPHASIDWTLDSGASIPIEERGAIEVTSVTGRNAAGDIVSVAVTPEGSAAANYGFDVTPARLISGLITERGVCPASGLSSLYPEQANGYPEQAKGRKK